MTDAQWKSLHDLARASDDVATEHSEAAEAAVAEIARLRAALATVRPTTVRVVPPYMSDERILSVRDAKRITVFVCDWGLVEEARGD